MKFLILMFLLLSSYLSFGNNPIIPNKGVTDPHIRIIDGRAYLSASHDKSANNKKFNMEDWWLWSSDDLVNWKLEYILKPEETYIGKPFNRCWATDRENKGNSGVQVRSRYDENAKVDGEFVGWMDGPQVDIEPNNPWRNGFIYDETRETKRWINPSLPDWNISKEEYAPQKVIYYWDNEGPGWNDMRIICKGLHIATYVNNIMVSDYNGTGVLDDEVHKKYNVSEKGHIALQLHKYSDNYMRYKNIEIRELE